MAAFCFGRQSYLRPFWFDELATWEMAQLPTWQARVEALRNAADAMPPLYYELVSFCLRLPIREELAVRLPAIVGYVLALGGTCWFTAQVGGAWAGVASAALLLICNARWYATEGRPHGLWIGLTAWVMASWLSTLRCRKSWNALILLVFLCLSAAIHHFSAVLLPLLVVATLVHDALRKRISLWIWLAFVGALPVVFWHVPFLREFRNYYGPTFWTKLTNSSVAEMYGALFSARLDWLAITVFAGLPLLLRSTRKGLRRARPEEVAAVALLACLIALPSLLVAASKITDFTPTARYGIPVILGVCCSIAWLSSSFSSLSQGRYLFVGVVSVLALLSVSREPAQGEVVQIHPPPEFPFPVKIQERSELPVAVASALDFLPWLHYSPELRPRLVFLFDQQLAMKHMAHDSMERILIKLPSAAMRLTPNYDAFVYQHQSFYMAARRGYGFWLPSGLKELDAKLELIAEERAWQLFLVTLPQEHTLVRR
jgi:hypothetical protein